MTGAAEKDDVAAIGLTVEDGVVTTARTEEAADAEKGANEDNEDNAAVEECAVSAANRYLIENDNKNRKSMH